MDCMFKNYGVHVTIKMICSEKVKYLEKRGLVRKYYKNLDGDFFGSFENQVKTFIYS